MVGRPWRCPENGELKAVKKLKLYEHSQSYLLTPNLSNRKVSKQSKKR